jgi:putative salt-induced outer membrane protein YdiY
MKIFLAFALILTASAASAYDYKPWKNTAELSVFSANGNTKTQAISGKDSFAYEFSPETKAEVEGGGYGARNDGRVMAEQYFALEKVSHKISERNYLFERYRWNRDLFAGVVQRHNSSVGAGRELWKTSSDLLVAELAPGYGNEQRINDEHKSFASARAYVKYTRDISESAKFSQDGDYTLSLADSRDAWVSTETALTGALTSVLSVKNAFVWKHDNRPVPDKRKDDTILSVALVASF